LARQKLYCHLSCLRELTLPRLPTAAVACACRSTGKAVKGSGCARPPFCPPLSMRMAHATSTVSIPKLCVGPSFCVGAALCVRPPPGNHIGLPLRLLQRFLATSGCRSELFCCIPLCTNLAWTREWRAPCGRKAAGRKGNGQA